MNPEIELLIKARNEAKRALNELQKQLRELETRLDRAQGGARGFGAGLVGLNQPISQVGQGLGNLVTALGGARLGWIAAGVAVLQFGREAVNASAQMQSFRQTVRATETSSYAASRRLDELTRLGKELVGIDIGGLLRFNSVFRAIGISAGQTDVILRSVTKANAELGRSTADTNRILNQISQGFAANKISAQDFNTVFREVPQFARAASTALGTTVTNAESLRTALQAAGLSAREGLIQVFAELDRTTLGADLDSYAAQVERLGESWFQFQALIGDIVVPTLTQFVDLLNQGVEAATNLTKSAQDFLDTSIDAIRTEEEFRERFLRATDQESFIRIIGARIAGLKEERAEVEEGTQQYARLTFQIRDLENIGAIRQRGQRARTRLLAEEEARLAGLEERWARRNELARDDVLATESSLARQRPYVAAIRQLATAFGDEGTATEKATTQTRNFSKEVVLATAEVRRAQRIFRNAEGVDAINQTTASAIESIERLRKLRVEQARATITDKEKLETRLAEIETQSRDTIETIVNNAIKRLASNEREGYREAERALEEHLRTRERIRNQPRYTRPVEDPFVRTVASVGARVARDAVFEGLGRQARDRAGERSESRRREAAGIALAQQLAPNVENALAVASAQPAIARGRAAALAIDKQIQQQQTRQLERAAEAEEAQLEKRLERYREYYELVNQLNFQSVEMFIASTIRATATYLQQLAIRDAAERAYAGISGLFSGSEAAAGAAGAASGGTGFLVAGGIAIASGILSSIFSRQREESTRSSRTFHNATNDALVELAVSRALMGSGRGTQTERQNNRQQARDVANAVDRGIRDASPAGTPTEIRVYVQIPFTDQYIEQITARQGVLERRGQ